MKGQSPEDMIISAAYAHFEAQKRKAEANLSVLVHRATGIGDHATHVEDAIALIKTAVEAQDCMDFILAEIHSQTKDAEG